MGFHPQMLIVVGKIITIFIVFVWSQYDDANIEKWTIGYGWHQNQEAKLNIVGGAMSWSHQQLFNICNCLITFSILLTSE